MFTHDSGEDVVEEEILSLKEDPRNLYQGKKILRVDFPLLIDFSRLWRNTDLVFGKMDVWVTWVQFKL